MEDDLRSKLDTASLLPRGRWKELWKAAAEEFVAPALVHVERAFADERPAGGDAAIAWLAKPELEIPRASLRTWTAAFETLKADTEEARKELQQRANTMVKTMAGSPDLELVMPLFLSALGPASWRVRMPILRAKWLTSIPCGLAAAVACVLTDRDGFSSNAFHELSKIRTLPSEARGALWMKIWADPDSVRWHWQSLARLGEPAAISAILHDAYTWGDRLPMRPALTRALCRVITREDPWLEGKHDATDPGAPKPVLIVARALDHLARVAEATGTTELAIETLDTRWSSLGRAGALARARLGCTDAVNALIPALAANVEPPLEPGVDPEDSLATFEWKRRHSAEEALLALAGVGVNAGAALEAARNAPESFERTLALAAIDPNPQTLDALIPLVERAISGAAEIRSQYEEGLITNDEYARKIVDDADFAKRLWTAQGMTDARRDVIARLRVALVAEHAAIRDDFAVKRFVE